MFPSYKLRTAPVKQSFSCRAVSLSCHQGLETWENGEYGQYFSLLFLVHHTTLLKLSISGTPPWFLFSDENNYRHAGWVCWCVLQLGSQLMTHTLTALLLVREKRCQEGDGAGITSHDKTATDCRAEAELVYASAFDTEWQATLRNSKKTLSIGQTETRTACRSAFRKGGFLGESCGKKRKLYFQNHCSD